MAVKSVTKNQLLIGGAVLLLGYVMLRGFKGVAKDAGGIAADVVVGAVEGVGEAARDIAVTTAETTWEVAKDLNQKYLVEPKERAWLNKMAVYDAGPQGFTVDEEKILLSVYRDRSSFGAFVPFYDNYLDYQARNRLEDYRASIF